METVNWPLAIERNRAALLRIVAALFAMAGLEPGRGVATLPRYLRNQVYRILRPAESAVRRLIIIAARGVEVTLRSTGAFRDPPATRLRIPEAEEPKGGTKESLPLIDPLKRFSLAPPKRRPKAFPRITCIGLSEPTPIPDNWIPSPDDEVGAERLCLRLAALGRALDDLDGYAKRLARWRARRDLGLNRSPRFSPMRPGWPPGYRRREFREVDAVLRECHSLAVYAQREDTS